MIKDLSERIKSDYESLLLEIQTIKQKVKHYETLINEKKTV